MSSARIARRMMIAAPVIAASMIALSGGPTQAAAPKAAAKPRVGTGGARVLFGNSVTLTGSVDPSGFPTSYYFEWGTTAAYGNQTPTVSLGSESGRMKVGQTINGIQQGVTYHFRIVALYSSGGQTQAPVLGVDHTFAILGELKFEVPKIPPVPIGSPFILSGVLRGVNSANHPLVLQASPYPYTTPFAPIGVPGVTNGNGRFAFRIANLSVTTAFRVQALGLLPVYSGPVIVSAAALVTLHVRKSGSPGLVRLYGTVTPASVGAPLVIQVLKPIVPNAPTSSEETTHWVNAFVTVVKKAGRTFSRFSVVVKPRFSGHYRAMVRLRSRAVVSGTSNEVVLHAAPRRGRKR
jgi:hypothetical protein